MDISRGGTRASNGKVYPNQAQRRLLRKLVAEKKEKSKDAGVTNRNRLVDFRKWAPELNKLGPPMRSALKWKNCWFHHKRQRNFFEFYYKTVRVASQKEKDVCQAKLPKKRKVCKKMQIRKFLELLKNKKDESESRGEPFTTITTADFRNWTKVLNKLGPIYPVDKWKMTWKTMKKQKKDNVYFKSEDFSKYKEIGCGSSEEFYLSDDDSAEDMEVQGTKPSEMCEKEASKRSARETDNEICDSFTESDVDQNFSSLCRICLKKRKTMNTFVDGSYRNISYLDIYHECIGEAFKIYPFCSTDICELCEKNFLNMYIFRGICLQTETKLSYIESQKDETFDSVEEEFSAEDNMPLLQVNIPDEYDEDSEMEGLEEKSIPEEIGESLDQKDVFLSVEPFDQCDEKMIFSERPKLFDKNEENTPENTGETKSISQDPMQCKAESKDACHVNEDSNSDPENNNMDSEKDSEVCDEENVESGRISRFHKRSVQENETKTGEKATKERPNKAQIALLRKLVAEKKGANEKFGVREFRLKNFDFKRWAPELNALGPPFRSGLKWKDCWFIHNKKKTGFYDFMYRNKRKNYGTDKPLSKNRQRLNPNPTMRQRMNKKQLRVFENFFKERREKSESSESRISLFTRDFVDLKRRLNLLGPPYRTVNEWKLTWRHTKKNSLKAFANDVQEIGYESSDAYYFSNESSDYSSDQGEENGDALKKNTRQAETGESSDSCAE
ncbi:uncharacterized protein LOC132262030 [Phlebotomus argentipes]|uniref:uncharacterized protein LOC132262030 n=1 Tax=Phlebotomus argentipes TaxID=94469 RepID=UPI002892F471|nr:uncharacterized protein LOC132262030 [Phlebotomus argentipes]